MANRTLRVAMEGVTGRLGTNQHLIRSVLAIRNEGGVLLRGGDRLVPEPVLVGRNPGKLAALAAAHGGLEWSADRAATLVDKTIDVYFDVAATGGRLERTLQAIAAGKHIYLEKPIAGSVAEAMTIVRAAKAAGVKAAAVQDKVYLPGFQKLRKVLELRLFRPHSVGAAGRRLVGVRWRSLSDAAFQLELPQEGGRRAGARYVSALALPAGEPDRPDQGRLVPPADADPEADRRNRKAHFRSMSRTRCSRRSNSRAARSHR